MRSVRMLSLSCLFGMIVSAAAANVSLQVDGTDREMISLKTGQAVVVEVVSDNASAYSVYAGFEDAGSALGSFVHSATLPAAGSLASVTPVSAPAAGYYANAAGASPAPSAGAHFEFTYTPDTVGFTVLYLYAGDAVTVLDSLVIAVEPATVGSAFTYQGRLIDDGEAQSGAYDFEFRLFDAPTGGVQLGETNLGEDLEVSSGYFTAELDFGAASYEGQSVWLEVSVREGASSDPFTVLLPRQRLTPTPYAGFAAKSDWKRLLNLPAGFADDVDNVGLTSETDPTVAASVKDGVSWGEIEKMPAGFADGVDNTGVTSETDPTVPASVKDGVSWGEVTGIPAGFADGVDNDTDTHLTEAQVEGFIANDTTTGYIPYDNGTKLVSSPLQSNGQEVSLGTSVRVDSKLHILTSSDIYGLYSDNAKAGGTNFGVVAAATGNTTGISYGLFGASLSPSGTNYGVYGTATTASTSTNYGVYGTASNSGTGGAWAGYFSGDMQATGHLLAATAAGTEAAIGTSINDQRKLNLYTNADVFGLFSENGTTSGERYALYGTATGNTSGYSYGVYGRSASGAGHNFGVWGEASTPTPYTNYAIFGTASNSGGGPAFAGYFMGDVRVTGALNKDYDLAIATDAGTVAIGTGVEYSRKLNVHGSGLVYYGIYSLVEDGGHYPGLSKYGICGESANPAGYNYGVYGRCVTDNEYSNYGVYGYARNTSGNAYAGYFDGNVYVTGILSAGTVVDRTPYPRDLATAYEAVMSMERLPDGEYREDDKEQQLDHSKLSPFIQSDDGHRDLSAAVSCQNEVIKDLVRRTQELEEARATIRRLEERLASLENSIQLSQPVTVKGTIQ